MQSVNESHFVTTNLSENSSNGSIVVVYETSNSLALAPRNITSPNKFASLISLEGDEEDLNRFRQRKKLMDIMTPSEKKKN